MRKLFVGQASIRFCKSGAGLQGWFERLCMQAIKILRGDDWMEVVVGQVLMAMHGELRYAFYARLHGVIHGPQTIEY
jgi:hypothetical protein